jgi:hypothetical protein
LAGFGEEVADDRRVSSPLKVPVLLRLHPLPGFSWLVYL